MSYKTSYRKNKSHRFRQVIDNDNFKANKDFLPNSLIHIYRLLKNDSCGFIFCNSVNVDYFKNCIEKHFTIKNIIVWVKNNWTAGDLYCAYGRQYEMIIYFNKGKKVINGRRDSDVWYFNRVSPDKSLHQNEKPLNLICKIIKKHSDLNDTVLDCFSGSGTTAIACMELNRNYICIEKDKDYYDISIERLERHKKDMANRLNLEFEEKQCKQYK